MKHNDEIDGMQMHYLLVSIRLVHSGFANAKGMMGDFGCNGQELMHSKMADAIMLAHNRIQTSNTFSDASNALNELVRDNSDHDTSLALLLVARIFHQFQEEQQFQGEQSC